MIPEFSFGSFVKQRRRELDLTQEELTQRVGCSAITIRKIEADDARPSVQIAERLAMALSIPLDDRAEFVRQARVTSPEPADIPTPVPALDEIGQEDLTGRAIRGYALAERLGAGGMGVVYHAIQPNVEREVAVKIILPAYANHPDFIRRFEAEAQLVARLEHPHIVPLYDYWREPGVAYLVMRLLRGGSVQALLANGPLQLESVSVLLEQICSALLTAHRIGVIHRDLKPANVLLDEDQNAYLADFGIAKNLGNPDLEDQTQVDMIVGSPEYMSPEQIRSLPIRPQTDIYSLGVMLYEMLTGSLPFTGPTLIDLIQQHLSAPLPPLAAKQSGLPVALDAVIGRATAKDAQDRFPDVRSLLADFRRAVNGLTLQTVFTPGFQEEADSELANPYKGLSAFGEADVEDFFGRETLIQKLQARLGEDGDLARFLAVVGPSGSGKSSVVKAGLIPAVRRGGLVGSENWFVVDFMPGPHPFEELETALLRVAVNPPDGLLAQLKDGDRGLLRAVNRILPGGDASAPVELILVIDQFEEVFTLVHDEAERALLLNSLVSATLDESSRVRVVITLRADFTDRPLRYIDFGELLQHRSEFVLPLSPDELERAILGPARRVGLKLEPGLAAAIIRDVTDQPGALPLMQYALTELFDRREGRTLTKVAYDEIGGVLGALGRRAEDAYASLDEAGQSVARELFLRLVTLGEGIEDTRRRVLRSELESLTSNRGRGEGQVSASGTLALAMGSVIDSFGKHRLLAFDRDPVTRGPTVEVAHEALLREWSRLREWLSESRTDVRMQRQLAQAAMEWRNAHRDVSFLLTGARLEQFDGWAETMSVALTSDERSFLDSSTAERDRSEAEERERQRRELETAHKLAETEKAKAESERRAATRLRTRNRAIAISGAVALALAILAGLFGLQSNQNASLAQQNLGAAQIANTQSAASAATAQAASLLAEDNAASALAEAQGRATQQAVAEAERDRADSEKRLATSRELAIAAINSLGIDPERSILLALHGLSQAYTREAEEALHQAVLALRLQFTLRGHSAPVNSVAYSPDGMRLASAGDDGLVKVWDTASGKELLTFRAHADWIDSVAFSPDGAWLVTAGDEDGIVKIWDAASGKELFTLKGQTGWVSRVIFSPDGARLATAGGDEGIIIIWDSTSGEELFTLSGHTGEISNIDFSPDGTRLVSAGFDGAIKIWDAAIGRQMLDIVSEAELWDVAFSPDGARIATSQLGGVVQVWDASNGQELNTLSGHTALTFGVAFSPDSTQLATASADSTIKLWDVASGRELLTLGGHSGFVYDIDFSPGGLHLATAGIDHTARIWDVSPAGSRELLTIAGDQFSNIAFNPDENRFITAGHDGTARVWDAKTGQELLVLSGHSDSVYNAVFSPDEAWIATAGADNTVRLWDAATGNELLILSGHGEGSVGPFPGVLDVAFSPVGTTIVSAGADGVAKLWDAATGKELLTLSGHTAGITSIAFPPDGTKIATGSGNPDQTARVWETATGKEILKLDQGDRIWALAYSPDGRRLVTAGNSGFVKVWDSASGQEVNDFVGHTSTVTGVAFSPDGSRLATASQDGTIRIWDVETGEELLTLPVQGKAVAFSRDGSRLVSVSMDGIARILAVRLEDLIEIARSRVTRPLTIEECQKYLHMEACPASP